MARVDARGGEARDSGARRRTSIAHPTRSAKIKSFPNGGDVRRAMKTSTLSSASPNGLIAAGGAGVGLHQRHRRGLAGQPGRPANRRECPVPAANGVCDDVGHGAHVPALERPQFRVAGDRHLAQPRKVRPTGRASADRGARDVILDGRLGAPPLADRVDHFCARFSLRRAAPPNAGSRRDRPRTRCPLYWESTSRRCAPRRRHLRRSRTASSPRSHRGRTTGVRPG